MAVRYLNTPPSNTLAARGSIPASTSSSTSTQTSTSNPAKPKPKRTNGHQKPKPIPTGLLDNDLARIRVSHWLTLLGDLSASAFYARWDAGKIPEPCGQDGPKGGRSYWTAAAVKSFLKEHQ